MIVLSQEAMCAYYITLRFKRSYMTEQLSVYCGLEKYLKFTACHEVPGVVCLQGLLSLLWSLFPLRLAHAQLKVLRTLNGCPQSRPLELQELCVTATSACAPSWDLTKRICSPCRDADIGSPYNGLYLHTCSCCTWHVAGVRGTQVAAGAVCSFIALALSMETPLR